MRVSELMALFNELHEAGMPLDAEVMAWCPESGAYQPVTGVQSASGQETLELCTDSDEEVF